MRGINVGKAKRIAMADLRTLIADAGGTEVRTLLNSGNAIFRSGHSATMMARRIESALVAQLGIASRTLVIEGTMLRRIVEENPLTTQQQNPASFLVAFLHPEAYVTLVPLTKFAWHPDALALTPRAGYLSCAGGLLDSQLLKAFSKAGGDLITTRNWATVEKLLAMID